MAHIWCIYIYIYIYTNIRCVSTAAVLLDAEGLEGAALQRAGRWVARPFSVQKSVGERQAPPKSIFFVCSRKVLDM